MKRGFILFFGIWLGLVPAGTLSAQDLPVFEKTTRWKIPDVETPSLHQAPWTYYKPTRIYLTPDDTVGEIAYWRRNFTDQFLECWSENRFYPASRIFGFVQDSVFFRSVAHDSYRIFVPLIYHDRLSLYYTRYIQNLDEVRMISMDPANPDYQNRMIVTGSVPRRYANEFTYFVAFPWDTATLVPVSRKTLAAFAETYLRAWPEAYREARSFDRSQFSKIAGYTLIPAAVAGTAAFLLIEGNPVYFVGIAAGMVVTYVSVRLFVRPKTLDPARMTGILRKCRFE